MSRRAIVLRLSCARQPRLLTRQAVADFRYGLDRLIAILFRFRPHPGFFIQPLDMNQAWVAANRAILDV